MNRRVNVFGAAVLLLGSGLAASSAAAGSSDKFRPGTAGVGDAYFPMDGNGGYDVRHYRLDLDYDPATDELSGLAKIRARATQNLSRFNLDLDGLTVRSITVDGKRAAWSRADGELSVTPRHGIRASDRFVTVVSYEGVPVPVEELGGVVGVIPTDDGALIQGEPHVASTWFPANDHPTDKASYTVRMTVPAGLEAISNGVLERTRTRGGRSTWTWRSREPMASYLATVSMGEFHVAGYRADGLRYWDAIDPDLFVDTTAQPRTGTRYAWSDQTGDGASYKRLSRELTIPVGGASLSFWVDRSTEEPWDFMFIEAHTVGADDWTTLRDVNGHNNQATGSSCPFWLGLHPFLANYQTDNGDETCSPSGTTGAWWAATGASDGYEQWQVDLTPYAGKQVEVSISYASDDIVQQPGVFVDDISMSTGEGTTSFEADADSMDGWGVSGSPEGSAPNENDWTATEGVLLGAVGERIQASFDRQPEIIAFLAADFGPYPFSAAGGVVDDYSTGFALENQTRPVYSPVFWDAGQNDGVVVHELAHQWYGNSVALGRWADVWLNEGFASYAEWLWSEHEGLGTTDEIFNFFYNDLFPPDDPFWELTIGDPGPDHLFDGEVYVRGAMTVHALREAVGDDAFFAILRRWAAADGNGTTAEFIALAEHISGHQLDDLFNAWLYTGTRPGSALAPANRSRSSIRTPEGAQRFLERIRLAEIRR